MLEYKLIEAAERIGCYMIAEGENIRVMNIDSLPSDLIQNIKGNKSKILAALKRDYEAKKMGFIIGLTGQLYFRSLNKNSIAYMEQIGCQWELRRETYIQEAIYSKVIYSNLAFDSVLSNGKSYFEYLEKVLEKQC